MVPGFRPILTLLLLALSWEEVVGRCTQSCPSAPGCIHLSNNNNGYCGSTSYRQVSRQGYRYYAEYYKWYYYTYCGILGLFKCREFRNRVRSVGGYYTYYQSERVCSWFCCSGYTGSAPSCRAVCSPECANGGQCTRPNVCSCATGWSGSTCTTAICSPPCANGGACTAPGSCSCVAGWRGVRCKDPPVTSSIGCSTSSSSSVNVYWSMPYVLQFGRRIDGYSIQYGRTSSSYYSTTYYDTASYSTSRTISGLSPYIRYQFRVAVDLIPNIPYTYGSWTYCTTREAVPGAVSSLSVASYSSTYIRVSWSSPAYPNGVLTSYYWYITDVVSEISHTRSGYTSSLYVTITDLHEGVRYRIYVYARNGAGRGSSSSVYGTTSVIRPTGPPLGLTTTKGSYLDITIHWSPPTILAQNGPISGYKVYWNGGSFTTLLTSYRFTGLSPYTTYTFSVATINAAGEASSSYRAITSETTRQTAPSGPTTNVSTTVTKNSITIAWSPPSNSQRNGVITGYSVYLGNRKFAMTTQLVYTIRNLSSFTNYSVTVSAITVAEGPKHFLVAVKTLEDVPNAPPANCKVQAGSNAIHTTWDPVPAISRNGIIRGYNVQWGEGLQQMTLRSVGVLQESFCITDLDLNVDYSVVVNARTNVGSGVKAIMEVTTTRQVLHQQVSALTAAPQSPTSVFVQWGRPQDYNVCLMKGFIIKYRSVTPFILHSAASIEVSIETFNSVLNKLQEHTTYEICVAVTDSFGHGQEEFFNVTTNEAAPSGGPLDLKVQVTSTSATSTWEPPEPIHRNGRITRYSCQLKGSGVTLVTTPLCEFTALKPHKTYAVYVAAFTSKGSGPATILTFSTAEGAPSGYPLNIKALPTDSSLEIVWSPLPNGTKNGRIIGYTVFWNDSSVNATHRKYIISALAPYTEYSVTVSAFTSAGHGPKSPVEVFRTTENVPSGPPTDIRSTPSTHSIYITWELPASAERNGIITDYSVFVENRKIVTTNSSAFNITGLTPFTDYQLEIAAHTGKGQGTKSPSTTVKTLMSYPGPVLSFAVEAINATRVKVQWIAPQLPNGDILSYKVSYLAVSDFSDQSAFVVVTSNSTMCWLDGLRQVTKYKVSIQAINSVGLGATTVDFVKMPDADECATGEHACEHECENTNGSYVCSCRDGYLLKSDGNQCADIDECLQSNHMCTHECLNTEGSFECSCRNGYSLHSNGKNCTDDDECLDGTHRCAQECKNTVGSYECLCNTGFILHEAGYACIDTNECESDSDECQHLCKNNEGSYSCACSPGFSLGGDGRSCFNIDECALDTDRCEQLCKDTQGSYNCSCRDGYSLAPDDVSCLRSCPPVPKIPHGTFTTVGSLESDLKSVALYACDRGYQITLDNGKTTFIGRTECVESSWNNLIPCQNIDECAASKQQICHPDKSVCIDSDGGYECQCNLGYERGFRNTSECTDLNECFAFPCDHICRNDFGTYTCRCKEGYELLKDESTCKKTTPKTCPDLIAPPSVRVVSVPLPSGHIRADLTCREEFAEFPTDVDPNPQYCINGYWTHQTLIQAYEIPDCESPEDPIAQVYAESPQEDIECDPDSDTGVVNLPELEAIIFGDGPGSAEDSCEPNGKKRGTGHLVLKFTFSVSVPRNCTSRSCYIGKLVTLRPAITRVRNKIASGEVLVSFTETNMSVNLIPGLTLKGSKKTCGTSGSIIKNNQCYQCSPGSFLNTTTRYPLCQFCPTDKYQSERGQTECIACLEGTQTRSAGSNSSELCVGLCTPGSFSRDGLAPCTLCPVGFYQPNASSDYCFQCDYQYVTIEAGATRKSQCGCPRGTYGQQCNETCSCMNGGTCLDDGSCKCTIWWTGYECSVPANFDQTCPDNICYPGVDCLRTSGTYITCGDCPEGMDGNGINCTTRCPPRSCHPAVTCFVDENGIAHCGDCPDGYSGNGSSTCTKLPQESKSFGITFPEGFKDAEKCVVFFSSNISFDPTLDILEVGSNLNNFTDHVDINGNISHVNLPSEHARSVTKLTVPQGRSIGVLGIVWERKTADVYMSYPYPETQPLKFIAVSVPTSEWVLRYKLSGFIFVSAEHDNTQVNISATVDIEVKNNDQRVDGAQTTYILSHNTRLEILSNSDLTGTVITSNKSVAVISGHSCGNVPYNVTGCDQLVEEMPPVHTWGTKFIVSTFERRSRGDYLKLVTSQETTVFLFCGRSEKVTYRVNALAHVLHFLPSGVSCFVRSSQPIIIAQFSVASTWSDDSGDPSMTVVPHLDQYQPNLTFYCPELCGISGYNHHVNVYYIAQVSSGTSFGRQKVMRDLNINGIEVMPDDVHRIPSRDKHSVHFVIKLPINPGVHTVSSRRGSIAALVYGANKFEFYSYSVYNPIDINECAASKRQLCHPDKSVCIDSDGGYECLCNKGYERGSINNSECTDINECLANPFPCDHICRNDFGTYTCQCREGYDLLKDASSCKKTTPKTCPDLIAPASVRVTYVPLPSGHMRADLTCREEFAEFSTDVDPTPLYCIKGYWTHQIQGYEIPDCKNGSKDPFAEVYAESPQEDIECDPDSDSEVVGLSEFEALMFGDGSVEAIASCEPNGKKRGTGHLVLKFTFSVSVPRNCTSRSCYIGKLATLRPAITRVRNKIASGEVFVSFTETNRSVNLIPGLTLKGSKKTCATSGSIIKNNQCYQCSPGSFLNTTTRYPLCQFCPTDTYQSERGQTECIACPGGTQTRFAGSNSSELCVGLCTPGSFSRDGLTPCTLCPVGFYQPNASSNYCFQCDYEYVTIEAGATRKSQCGCPRGTYGQQCNETCSCLNGGTCLDDGSCKCTIWWTGYECSVPAPAAEI